MAEYNALFFAYFYTKYHSRTMLSFISMPHLDTYEAKKDDKIPVCLDTDFSVHIVCCA